jgi:hypothetical protein
MSYNKLLREYKALREKQMKNSMYEQTILSDKVQVAKHVRIMFNSTNNQSNGN